jgi:hypothetical protein
LKHSRKACTHVRRRPTEETVPSKPDEAQSSVTLSLGDGSVDHLAPHGAGQHRAHRRWMATTWTRSTPSMRSSRPNWSAFRSSAATPSAPTSASWAALLLASLAVLAGVAIYRGAPGRQGRAAGGNTGDSLMQSQRLAKSVSQALVGSPQAFPDVRDSATVLARSVRGLKDGDDETCA